MPAENPEIKILAADTWELIAADIVSGFAHVLDPSVVYYQTYRLTGDPVPDPEPVPGDADFEGAVIYNRIDRIAGQSVSVGGAIVGAITPIDFYIYAFGGPGRIRLDRGA